MFSKKEAFPLSSELVRTFAQTHYSDLTLHPKMIEQLSWLQTNSVNTSQSNVNASKTPINIEVKRTLCRLNSLTLFIEGGQSAYSTFIQSQSEDVILSEDNFNRLSDFIQALSHPARACLMATCFITKSDQAIKEVPVKNRNELPTDSEQFITHMVTHFPTIFPICSLLDPESIDLLKYAFYKNTHARHMLDMEGGYNMTADIAEAIRLRTITYEQYNLWFARWIINIAGLDGHVNHRGSIYLTEPVAQGIWALKLELDQLWLNPNHQVIDHYLIFRKKQLEVSHVYIAYLGALMRQYDPKDGLKMISWFKNLSEDEQQQKIKGFQLQLTETKVTPTYKPTVLASLLKLGCPISKALTLFTEIESQAMQVYMEALATGLIAHSTPLSYRNVAYEESLIPLRAFYNRNHRLPDFTIHSDGYLSITTASLQNTRVIRYVIFSIGQFFASDPSILKAKLTEFYTKYGQSNVTGDIIWQFLTKSNANDRTPLHDLRMGGDLFDFWKNIIQIQFPINTQNLDEQMLFNEFKEIWVSMCTIQSQTMERINNFIAYLQEHPDTIFLLISHTNHAHFEKIQTQIQQYFGDRFPKNQMMFITSMDSQQEAHLDTLRYALNAIDFQPGDELISCLNTIQDDHLVHYIELPKTFNLNDFKHAVSTTTLTP